MHSGGATYLKLRAVVFISTWADLREDTMINPALAFWPIFGPLGPTAGPGSPRTDPIRKTTNVLAIASGSPKGVPLLLSEAGNQARLCSDAVDCRCSFRFGGVALPGRSSSLCFDGQTGNKRRASLPLPPPKLKDLRGRPRKGRWQMFRSYKCPPLGTLTLQIAVCSPGSR